LLGRMWSGRPRRVPEPHRAAGVYGLLVAGVARHR
jgi:hypothetical protein